MAEEPPGDNVLREMGIHKSWNKGVYLGERSAARLYYGKACIDGCLILLLKLKLKAKGELCGHKGINIYRRGTGESCINENQLG
ncbi:MAG: hypothetical protein QNK40_04580 [Desulfobacterales bacterium]|nr:hypothetical protein [Desulfobacterales bacterium]MDX2508599.1 hypothetical protein [Desulfobacterales bacterium]